MKCIHLGRLYSNCHKIWESNWVKKVGGKLLRITDQGRRNPWAGWSALSILNFYISTYKKKPFLSIQVKKIQFSRQFF